MQRYSERGVAHIFALILLLVGIAVGVYLIQNPQFLNSFAGNPPIVIKGADGSQLSPNKDGVPSTASTKIVVELNSPLGPAGVKTDTTLQASPSPTVNYSLTGLKKAYGAKRGQPKYDPQYDLNNDGVINIIDFALLIPKLQSKPEPKTKPQTTTVSYRLTEDALNINQLPFVPYTADPMVVNYEFRDKKPGKKFIWVDFQDSKGKIQRRSTPVEITAPAVPASACGADLSYTCTSSGNRLTVNWSLKNKYGGNSCNIFLKDSRGDHQINGSNYAGPCSGSWSDTSLDGRTVSIGDRYQLFVSNGDPAGGCYNQQKGDTTLVCVTPTATPTPIPTAVPDQGGFEVGLEAGEQHDTSRVNLVAESGAKWVRLNFVGSNWAAGSSDVNTYNNIINAYRNKNIKIIGLIGIQSVSGGYDRNHPENFTQKFTDTASDIVARFGDRVKVYELFNEPNDWAGGSSSQVPEKYFATYLASIYQRIKIDQGRGDIFLNSGPLFSFDLNNGSSYLQNTYNEGKNLSGSLNWNTIKSKTGSYPLDGVGYHIYVAQGGGDQSQVETKVKANLDSIKSVLNRVDSGKKMWITEFGWGTGLGGMNETIQASNLEKAYSVFKNYPAVRMAMWFTLQDFDGSKWGLVKGDGGKKSAWYAFQRAGSNTNTCSASIDYSCSVSDNKLNVSWNLTNKYGGNSCNIYIKDNRGDHQINGSNYSGPCSGSWSSNTLDGSAVSGGGRYQLFVSNGDPSGGCYNQPRGDVTLNCNYQ